MENKRNLKFFTAPPVSIINIIGWVIAVIGALLLLFFSRYSVLMPFGMGGLLIGIVLVIIGGTGKASPSDIDFYIYDKVKYLEETAQKKHEVYESQFNRIIKPVMLQGFDFNAKEDFYFRKGSDGRNRGSIYNKCVIYFTREKLYIYGMHFSLIHPENETEIMSVHRFVELDHAEIIEGEYKFKQGERELKVPTCTFKLVTAKGDVPLNICVDYGADVDKAVEDINHIIAVSKENAAKKAAEKAKKAD